MKRMKVQAMVAVLGFVAGAAFADPDGLVTRASRYSAAETLGRLEAAIAGAGMTIFARIDHAAAAEKVGLRMPASHVVVFGNPRGGTPLMLKAPTVAIDLPLKMLVWEDAGGKVWLSYNTASWVASRHALGGADGPVSGMNGALEKLSARVLE